MMAMVFGFIGAAVGLCLSLAWLSIYLIAGWPAVTLQQMIGLVLAGAVLAQPIWVALYLWFNFAE